MFGIFKKKNSTTQVLNMARWPMSAFRRLDTCQPSIWNNRLGSQNRLLPQFSKLWTISLRSLW